MLEQTVYINNELTKSEFEIQKLIRKKAMVEKQKRSELKITYKKLIVNGKIWGWGEQEEALRNWIHEEDKMKAKKIDNAKLTVTTEEEKRRENTCI